MLASPTALMEASMYDEGASGDARPQTYGVPLSIRRGKGER